MLHLGNLQKCRLTRKPCKHHPRNIAHPDSYRDHQNSTHPMKHFAFAALIGILLTGCIKDDIVDDAQDPMLRITTLVDTLANNSSYQFEYMYLNGIGREEMVNVTWASSDTSASTIDENGLAQAQDDGWAYISVEYLGDTIPLKDSLMVNIGEETVVMTTQRSGVVNTTSSYELSGNFILTANGPDLELQFANNYVASSALPGLYIYLSNNASTNVGAYEIGPVTDFSGAHSYTIPNTGILDYQYVLYFCKPFNVKVGHGEIE